MDYAIHLDELRNSGNYRSIPNGHDDGIIDFSTNDYLGLATRRDIQADFFNSESNRMIAMTSSASRLLASNQDEYSKLEKALADDFQRETLLFNSGYHANTGLISSLADSHTLILADRLVHASIIDGIKLSKGKFTRFRHNDYEHLKQMLDREAGNYERIIIVVESVYSMDGDKADIDRIAAIKRNYDNAMLYVDEAHAFGVEGPDGLGICRHSRYYDDVDIVVGTFGKAAASFGAFCAVSPTIRNFAVNCARSFIFSTALPPISCAWTRHLLPIIKQMGPEREHLKRLSARLSSALAEILPPDTPVNAGHIQPVIIGDARKVVELSRKLLDDGVKVLPIRTPTVPPGTERLRISLSATMTTDHIDKLTEALRVCLL